MKIICIARNYKSHINEMTSKIPNKPIFFMKPDTSILLNKMPFYIPEFTKELNYECELVIKINRVGKNIQQEFAHKYYSEIGLGIDFTARDLQRNCKINGEPWEIAKAFDNSIVISKTFISTTLINLKKIQFNLMKNNEVVQEGNSNEMIFSFNQIIAYISKFVTLKIGDLIFTGTPSGVGNVSRNDKLKGYLNNIEMFNLTVK